MFLEQELKMVVSLGLKMFQIEMSLNKKVKIISPLDSSLIVLDKNKNVSIV